jgi:hypothetical protein
MPRQTKFTEIVNNENQLLLNLVLTPIQIRLSSEIGPTGPLSDLLEEWMVLTLIKNNYLYTVTTDFENDFDDVRIL